MTGPGAFADHFGRQAAAYAAARPTYPAALFDALADLAPARDLAWDVGTGSGQAAVELGERFECVVASDGSEGQLAHATAHPNVTYVHATAESPPAAAQGAALVTVAQALHWFDLDAFDAAVRATLRPGGLVAAWSYGLFDVEGDAGAILRSLHDDVLGAFWPAGRRHVLDGYRDLRVPGAPVDVPGFEMRVRWTLPEVLQYVESWSATRRSREGGGDPTADSIAGLRDAWGEPGDERTVRWPLTILAGRVD